MGQQQSNKPNIYSYLNYREFIRDFIDYLKFMNQYSSRNFARKAGLGSNGYINMIIKGQRELSNKSAEGIAQALELSPRETEFFLLLIRFNKSDDLGEQNLLFSEIQRYKSTEDSSALIDQFLYYSNWYNVAIAESFSLQWQDINLENLSRKFGVSPSKVKKSIALLQRLELIEVDDNEKVRRTTGIIKLPTEIQSMLVRNFHTQMIEKSLRSVSEVGPDKRDLSAMTLKIPPEEFSYIKKQIWKFLEKLANRYSASNFNEGEVYQLNTQIFPLSKKD